MYRARCGACGYLCSRERWVDIASILLTAGAVIVALFVAYNVLHYLLFFLATHPKDAGRIGGVLNEFERRQLVEWTPKADDFLKHDDENRTYDDVFVTYRGEHDNYSTCVFPRAVFTQPYSAEHLLLEPEDGMRLLDLGGGSGAGASRPAPPPGAGGRDAPPGPRVRFGGGGLRPRKKVPRRDRGRDEFRGASRDM